MIHVLDMNPVFPLALNPALFTFCLLHLQFQNLHCAKNFYLLYELAKFHRRTDLQLWVRTLDALLHISPDVRLWFLNLLAGDRAKEYLGYGLFKKLCLLFVSFTVCRHFYFPSISHFFFKTMLRVNWF